MLYINRILTLLRRIIGREKYHPMLTYPIFLLRVAICRHRYAKTLARLRKKRLSGAKIRIMFLTMDISKWKCQSLYDLLDDNAFFEPFVGLTMTDEDEHHSSDQIVMRNAAARAFYERHGCRVVEACLPEKRKALAPARFDVDVVFYQVPWGMLGEQTVWNVSKYALCCYVPYGIETVAPSGKSERFNLDHMADFHSLLYALFQWSGPYARHYKSVMRNYEWAGDVYGFGHTALDGYTSIKPSSEWIGYVIFAPHFAFEYNGQIPILNIGTFQWSGKTMLEYAKRHREIKWLFKPHPKLRERLVEIGYMSKDAVDAYYRDWETVGEACYDSAYADYFINSKAMITDSNSFLMEYMAVGRPLIHLISENDNTVVCEEARPVLDSFYKARNESELLEWLHQIVEEGQDSRKAQRINASRNACVLGNHAGRRIMDWLERKCSA